MPKSLIVNLRILFGLLRGYTQETPRYLVKIHNLILCFKTWGQEFSTLLVNSVAVQYLYHGRYQKFLYGYKVGSLDCYYKGLYAIDT